MPAVLLYGIVMIVYILYIYEIIVYQVPVRVRPAPRLPYRTVLRYGMIVGITGVIIRSNSYSYIIIIMRPGTIIYIYLFHNIIVHSECRNYRYIHDCAFVPRCREVKNAGSHVTRYGSSPGFELEHRIWRRLRSGLTGCDE